MLRALSYNLDNLFWHLVNLLDNGRLPRLQVQMLNSIALLVYLTLSCLEIPGVPGSQAALLVPLPQRGGEGPSGQNL